jgi:hypothetical protein
VEKCLQVYDKVVLRGCEGPWTTAPMFEKDIFVYTEESEGDRCYQINTLLLDGPYDGWTKDDQVELTQPGSFSLA